ncbi:MAG: DUF1844 domain-containing protein [Candidatus Omnitrophica bacterium]|nr:DUF1844 domain-containing protein [Candidatus Omnitrophota bacterium]
MEEKEVHYTKKRVDESWKESVSKDQGAAPEAKEKGRLSFSNFISSLGIQALMHMGELSTTSNEKVQVDLAAAQEMIDLLLMLKDKTQGNLTPEEASLFGSLIPELQLKFVQHKVA